VDNDPLGVPSVGNYCSAYLEAYLPYVSNIKHEKGRGFFIEQISHHCFLSFLYFFLTSWYLVITANPQNQHQAKHKPTSPESVKTGIKKADKPGDDKRR